MDSTNKGNADKEMMEATEMDDAPAQRVLRAEDPATSAKKKRAHRTKQQHK